MSLSLIFISKRRLSYVIPSWTGFNILTRNEMPLLSSSNIQYFTSIDSARGRGDGGGGGISKYPLISVMNEKRDKCLILMLNLTVSKHTRSEAGKNKVIIKRVSNILMN